MSQILLGPIGFGVALQDRIRHWRRLAERSISKLGLTSCEFRVLKLLSESGPCPMVDLAKEQMITQAAVTGIVDHLGGLGFVQRTRSKSDRRVVAISITRKGRDEVKEGIRLFKKFIEKATGGLTATETRTLVTILDRMLEAAEKAEH